MNVALGLRCRLRDTVELGGRKKGEVTHRRSEFAYEGAE
jgi:hypothetical protein